MIPHPSRQRGTTKAISKLIETATYITYCPTHNFKYN